MSAKQEILVLQVQGGELRLVRAAPAGAAVELAHACSFRSAGKNDDDNSPLRDENLLDALAEYVAQNDWAGKDFVCVIGGSPVACQHYDMPPLKGGALRQAALLKLGQQLHFDVAEAVVAVDAPALKQVRHLSSRERGGVSAGQAGRRAAAEGNAKPIRVSVAALHKQHAQAAAEAAARAKLNLKALTAAPAALAALSDEVFGEAAGLHALLYLDEDAATLIVREGPLPCVTAELPIGVSELTKALMRPIISGEDILQLDAEQAAALRDEVGIPRPEERIESVGITGDRLLPLIEPVLQQFTKQVVQWLTFATTTAGGGRDGDSAVGGLTGEQAEPDGVPVERVGETVSSASGKVSALREIVLVGPGARIRGLAETLASRLSLPVRAEDWLAGRAKWATGAQGSSLDAFAPAIGAIRSISTASAKKRLFRRSAADSPIAGALPDLLPREIHRQRRLARIRNRAAWYAAAAAAAIAGISVLLNQAAPPTQAERAREQQLAEVRRIVELNTLRAAEQKAVADLQDQFDDFARRSPLWVGVFKELSTLLPRDFQATAFEVRTGDTGMRFVVSGAVYPTTASRGFDEVVEETLRLLQRSVFFDQVQLLTANREASREHPDAVGTLSVEMNLVYERPANRALAARR